MMTRKKRITLIIVIVVLVLLIIGGIFAFLYLNTDMFKSNQTLFVKYLGKNSENIQGLQNIVNKTEYDELLKTNPYNVTSEIKVNYTQNVGTTEENNNNSINQLKMTIEGQTDNKNNYDYRNIKLLKNDEQVMQNEILHTSNNYGIKFTDLFNQYVVVENQNLKDLLKRIGYTDEQIEYVPDSIDFNNDILQDIKFSNEDIESLINKYASIITQNIGETNFQRQKNQIVEINGQNYLANAYILSLTKEQLNNVYINILENLKEDEIILNKIDKIQNKINQLTLGEYNKDLKNEFTQKIDLTIGRIRQTNIGTDETKIIVYENNGKTISTSIQTQEYQMNLNCLNGYNELVINENNTETYKITIENVDNKLAINIENNKNQKSSLSIERTYEENDKKKDENYKVLYEIDDKKIEANINKTTEIAPIMENAQVFNNDNAVVLNHLEDSMMKEIINRVQTGLNEKIESVKQQINYPDIEQMLKDIGLIKDTGILVSAGISETEKNRFNSMFELLKGENLSGETISASIQSVKDNLLTVDIVNNNELKIGVSRNQSNEEIVNVLINFFNENQNEKYNIDVEYDENGLVNQLIIKEIKDE